jgi:transposase InsO family protein
VPGEYSVSRPLEVVQIDHTEIDIIVVDERTRFPMPSRPWLTLTIDVFSRVVTGFHVSMNAPSRVSVDLCLLNSIFDKTAWLGEREIDQDWPRERRARRRKGAIGRAGCRAGGLPAGFAAADSRTTTTRSTSPPTSF